MSYQKIHSLLNTRLGTLVGLPTIQLQNTRNIGQTGVPFTRGTLLPAKAIPSSVGTTGKDNLSGIFQVDLFVPQDTGTDAVNTLADSVIAHFPRGLILVDRTLNLHISRAYCEVGRRIEPFYMLPVIVQWTAIV